MPTLPTLLKLLHILAAFVLVAGMLGRSVTFRLARITPDVRTAVALLNASHVFERAFVIPGSELVLLFGALAGWRAGWPLLGFLQGARANWLLVSLVLFLSLIPFIPLYLIPARKRREQAAREAIAAGQITPALQAAMNDRGVAAYRAYEFVVVLVIVVLMVAKPF